MKSKDLASSFQKGKFLLFAVLKIVKALQIQTETDSEPQTFACNE